MIRLNCNQKLKYLSASRHRMEYWMNADWTLGCGKESYKWTGKWANLFYSALNFMTICSYIQLNVPKGILTMCKNGWLSLSWIVWVKVLIVYYVAMCQRSIVFRVFGKVAIFILSGVLWSTKATLKYMLNAVKYW